VVYTASVIAEVVSSDCSLCPLNHFRLLNAADDTAYLGGVASLDVDNNLVVLTDTPVSSLSLLLEAYMDPSTQAECAFIDSQQVVLSLEICGSETITVKDEDWPYKQDLQVRWNETNDNLIV
jgi:hypothetical protein